MLFPTMESSKRSTLLPNFNLVEVFSRIGHPLSILSVIVGLVIWEITGRILGALFVAPPSLVVQAAYELIISGELLQAYFGSLQHMFVGFVIGTGIAIPLGFLIGQSKIAKWIFNPYIDAIYSTPPIAYLALVVAWFGLRFNARVFFVFIFCFFEILIVTIEGVESVKNTYAKIGRSFDTSWLQYQRMIIFPASLPFVFSSLRLGVGRAVRGMIVAEIFLAVVYLGRLLVQGAIRFDTATQLTVVATIAVTGVTAQYLVEAIEERTLPWHFKE